MGAALQLQQLQGEHASGQAAAAVGRESSQLLADAAAAVAVAEQLAPVAAAELADYAAAAAAAFAAVSDCSAECV